MSDVDDVKKQLRKKQEAPKPINAGRLLSSGSTLLNLACTGRPEGAFPKGSYIFFVGDSNSGKTWYSMTLLAEAAINKRFRKYRFIYDAPEGGAQMDIGYYFGKRVAKRLIGHGDFADDSPYPSASIEHFYKNVNEAVDESPCIYILDSMDALNPASAEKKFIEDNKALDNDKALDGSYGTEKAKLNSTNLRRIIPKLRESGSILIIINQTRDNIGFGAQFNPKTRGGGKALGFYADIEIWTSVKGNVKKTVKGKARSVGTQSRCLIKRSRVTGKKADITVPIYHRHGIDDVGSMIEWLVEEKHWAKHKHIHADDFDFTGSIDKLIAHIEEEELEKDLSDIVGMVWQEIETKSTVKRKRRYE